MNKNYNGITNRGFTILELMIVLVIVAIGVALAVPTYQDVVQRRETMAKAEGLAALLAFAQSEAMKYNQMISVQLTWNNKDDWCIGANEGNTGCDCEEVDTTAGNYCSLNDVPKIITSATQTRSSMSTHSVDTTLVFDPIRGTMAAADLLNDHSFTMRSDNNNWVVRVDVGVTGRIRICNPESDKAIPGYKVCT